MKDIFQDMYLMSEYIPTPAEAHEYKIPETVVVDDEAFDELEALLRGD